MGLFNKKKKLNFPLKPSEPTLDEQYIRKYDALQHEVFSALVIRRPKFHATFTYSRPVLPTINLRHLTNFDARERPCECGLCDITFLEKTDYRSEEEHDVLALRVEHPNFSVDHIWICCDRKACRARMDLLVAKRDAEEAAASEKHQREQRENKELFLQEVKFLNSPPAVDNKKPTEWI